MRTLVLALWGLSALAGPVLAGESENGWRFNDFFFKHNVLFSEFKYFNFSSPGLFGALTYSVASPPLASRVTVTGHFVRDGRTVHVRRTFSLSCVKASAQRIDAEFCGQGGIDVLSWPGPRGGDAKLRVRQTAGPVRWDLVYTVPREQVTREVSHFPLDGPALVNWFMNWSPVFRSGRVQGTVQLPDELITVDTETSYHDQNWEIWYPKWQPFNWLHFTAVDSAGERADVTLVEFPKNSSIAPGLTLYSGGAKKFWPQGGYKLEPIGEARTAVTRHPGDLKKGSVQLQPTGRSDGERLLPGGYRIRTIDGLLEAELDVVSAVSTSNEPKAPKAGGEETLVDELRMLAHVRFTAHDGKPREASGPAEWMKTETVRAP